MHNAHILFGIFCMLFTMVLLDLYRILFGGSVIGTIIMIIALGATILGVFCALYGLANHSSK